MLSSHLNSVIEDLIVQNKYTVNWKMSSPKF